MRVHILLAAILLAASPAWAVNKCKGPDGKTVYQSEPCPGGEKVNLSGAGTADPTSPAARYWQREAARLERDNRVNDHIMHARVSVGMTAEQVRQSWGEPTRINSTLTSSGRREQWVYDLGRFRAQYVYVENDRVTSVQSRD